MALKKKRNGHFHTHYTGERKKGNTAELSAKLAPLEEKRGEGVKPGSGNGGAIIVDKSSVKLPGGFADEDKATSRIFGFDPIAIVILILMLAFIAFIAWQVSLMEPPAN
jgi:hypothetical protein